MVRSATTSASAPTSIPTPATQAAFDTLRDTGDAASWTNLNGLWEWEKAATAAGDVAGDALASPPFGKTLNGSILVPFPVESCLSGVAPPNSGAVVQEMWYRLVFDKEAGDADRTLLHFGAIDWQSSVYLNGKLLGNHTGGYDGFSYDVTDGLKATQNELLVYAFDPSDKGAQPNGKQRISAIDSPGGDTYTPSSGIWQTVWLEAVPKAYISALHINQASEDTLVVSADVAGGSMRQGGKLTSSASGDISFKVQDASGKTVAEGTGISSQNVTIQVPNARVWGTTDPFLYNLVVTHTGGVGGGEAVSQDSVISYFGLRKRRGEKGLRNEVI